MNMTDCAKGRARQRSDSHIDFQALVIQLNETTKWIGGNQLDCVIRIAKEVPGPGEYNAELKELSTRTNSRVYVPSESTITPEERPKSGLARFGPGIPPEARRKPRPKEVNENSAQSRHSIQNNRKRTSSTTLGSIGCRNRTPTARWLSQLSQRTTSEAERCRSITMQVTAWAALHLVALSVCVVQKHLV